MNRDLESICKDTITRYPYSSRNDDNDYTYDMNHPITIKACIIRGGDKIRRDKNGSEYVCKCKIICNTDMIDDRDMIEFTGLNVKHPDFESFPVQDREKNVLDHYVIYIK